MSKTKLIITYNGVEAPVGDCRKIAGHYYIIGDLTKKGSGQCYLYEETYYRETSPKLQWDYELQKYNHVDNMVKGYTPDGIGYFTKNLTENFQCADGLMAFNKESAINNNLRWDFGSGYYNNPNNLRASKPVNLNRKPGYNSLPTETYSLTDYDTSNIKQEFAKLKIEDNIFDKFLHNYNYGLEVETDSGWFPENLYYKLGCVPLKDGSILGTEITTLVYPPKVDLIDKLFQACSDYTAASHNNSLHVNLSGFKNSPLFRVALYVLYYRIQPEILAFTPLYKRELSYFQEKRGGPKDHCKPMESLGIVRRYNKENLKTQVDESDKIIFKFLNEGIWDSEHNIDTRRHVRQGQQKWEHQNRYYALNMMPLYFGNVANSRIEYRLHSGTVNKYKSLIWMFICAAITKFVENNAERILIGQDKILLEDILYETIIKDDSEEERFLLRYIQGYIAERSAKNTAYVMSHRGPIYGDEFSRDNTYVFEIQKKSPFNYELSKSLEEIGKPTKKGAYL